ncbi:MAG: hypothetical protein P4M08_10465 [Oligoflexia bacterium]|nr:hypothetical protein [Oligoflexia bacterium]
MSIQRNLSALLIATCATAALAAPSFAATRGMHPVHAKATARKSTEHKSASRKGVAKASATQKRSGGERRGKDRIKAAPAKANGGQAV